MKKDLSVRLDLERSNIDVQGLTLTWWDYMLTIVDGGMNLEFREHFSSHPFPHFIDPVGMEILV